MPAVFIHAKWRMTVASGQAEYRRPALPSGIVNPAAGKSSAAPSSRVSGHISTVVVATEEVLFENQCHQRLEGEPSPGAPNHP